MYFNCCSPQSCYLTKIRKTWLNIVNFLTEGELYLVNCVFFLLFQYSLHYLGDVIWNYKGRVCERDRERQVVEFFFLFATDHFRLDINIIMVPYNFNDKIFSWDELFSPTSVSVFSSITCPPEICVWDCWSPLRRCLVYCRSTLCEPPGYLFVEFN